MDKSAIAATFVDYRRIKTRKVHQVIFEVASETWPEVYAALGEPNIESSEWFAIAKMRGVTPEPTKGAYWAGQAAMMCNNPDFWRYLPAKGIVDADVQVDADLAAEVVRRQCCVTSRAHLDHDDEAAKEFRQLKSDFEFWLSVQGSPKQQVRAAS